MASYNASYPEQVVDLLTRSPNMRFGEIQQATGIPVGSLHAVLRRLISGGEIHLVQLTKAQHRYRIGCSPCHAEVLARDFDVDTSQRGPNGGRLIRFGDRWPTVHALTAVPRGLSGGSSLNYLYE